MRHWLDTSIYAGYGAPAVRVRFEKCAHGVWKDPSKPCHPDHESLTNHPEGIES